ncbi:MAG: GNAT family N-acetyltransferase [Candidatus Hodarchaeales archaeon]
MGLKGYTFQPFEKSDIEEVAGLQVFHWGPGIEENKQHLKWKYYDNPNSKNPIAYTVKRNGAVVGFMGLIPTRWRVKERTIAFVSYADACIHPDHRGMGIYPHLIQSLIDEVQDSGYQGFLNLSNNAITSHVMEKMGFISLREKSYYKKVNYYRILKNKLFEGKSRGRSSGNVKFSLTPDIDGMLEFDEVTRNSEKIQLLKDDSFYNWRFQSKKRNYNFFYSYHDGEMTAYMVLLVNYRGSARIIDFAYDNPRYIMETMGSIIRGNNYSIITLMDVNIDKEILSILNEYGFSKKQFYDHFLRKESASYISYRPIEYPDGPVEESFFTDIDNWDIREIASDGV